QVLGLCLPRSILAIQAMLACLKCGAAYLALDPDYPSARRNMMLRDAKIEFCLLHQDSRIRAGELAAASDCELIWLDQSALQLAWQQAASSNLDLPGLQPEQAAYVIYTSGSSGQPKGVVAAHRSIVNRLHWMQQAWPARDDEVFCQKTSLGFVDHVAEIFQPLVLGQPLVIIDTDDTLDPARFAQRIQAHRITRLTLVPSLLRLLCDQQVLSQMRSLRLVISSGEALQLSDARAFYQALPAATLLNLYGSSEVGADVSAYQMVAPDDNPAVMQYFHAADTAALPFKPLPSLSLDSAFRSEFCATGIPQQACGYEAYLAQLNQSILPYVVDVSSQRFIGHMTSKLPHFIPDLNRLIAQLNQNMVKVETSNSLTLIERQVLASLHRLFFQLDGTFYDQHCQDPQHVFGVVTGGGSVANLTALWGARNRALLAAGATLAGLRSEGAHAVAQRLGFRRCVVLGTRLMHYSMRKSMALMGLGEQALMTVAQDAQQKMSLPDLQQRLQQCQRENCLVIAIVGIAGATETGSIDPLPEIAAIARAHGVHFHVDAAWGGAFQLSPRYRHLLEGIEQADSITLCPHKQLYLSQGISLCLLRDTLAANCIATHANYQAQPGSYDLGQYSVEGSRPAHALLLHASLHVLAQDGYAWLLQQNMAKTRYFAQLIKSCDAFELIAEPELNILNYRYIPLALRGQPAQSGQRDQSEWSPEDNQQISQAVSTIQQQQFLLGQSFCSKTTLQLARWPGQALTVFRIVLANPLTSFDDLRAVLQDQLRIASEIIEAPGSQARNQLPELSGQAAQLLGQSIVPIGKPIANTTLYVLDAQLNQVPPGLPGQLFIGGAGLALGYLHQPQMTAEKFIDSPFEAGQKLYQSGDWVRWRDDGNLEYLGRMDEQIKIRGMRVEPGEIEAQLQQHPLVRQAVVALMRPAGQAGAEPLLTAYLVPRQDLAAAAAQPDALPDVTPAHQLDPLVLQAQLHTALAKCLPEHMLPALYVVVARLPLNPNGKIDRRALPAPGLPQRHSIAPASSATEAALCQIWQHCLGLERVGREDHFFRIGGHSLSLSKMAMQCNQHFGLNLPFKDFFTHPLLADLAILIEREQAGQAMFAQLSQTLPEGHTSLML
ncbi:MAG: Tyrocidine synthase 3, partial [Pseudomonadota bacterium]